MFYLRLVRIISTFVHCCGEILTAGIGVDLPILVKRSASCEEENDIGDPAENNNVEYRLDVFCGWQAIGDASKECQHAYFQRPQHTRVGEPSYYESLGASYPHCRFCCAYVLAVLIGHVGVVTTLGYDVCHGRHGSKEYLVIHQSLACCVGAWCTHPCYRHQVIIVVQTSQSDHLDAGVVPQEHNNGCDAVLYPCFDDELLKGRRHNRQLKIQLDGCIASLRSSGTGQSGL
jgi:hypothetical protein